MSSFKVFARQANRMVVAIAVLVSAVVPALVPSLASADQLLDRSIQLSSSTIKATNVSYTVNFKTVKAAGAIVLDFCQDSPLVGTTCTAPLGFTAAGAALDSASTTAGYAVTGTPGASTVKLTKTINAGDTLSFVLTGITNPDGAGSLYARILTYTDSTAASSYTDTAPGTYEDNGSVAMSITNNVAVSGAVLESMTFCVAKATITSNCANANANPPTLKLGQDLGNGVVALGTTTSTGTLDTQITTNAVNGAVIYLKSNAVNCGGLKLVGSTDPNNCFIAPAGTTGTIGAGDAKFGVKLGTAFATSGVTDANGTIQAASATYDTTNYRLNGVANNNTGVTSTYGDAFLNTNDLPVNNQNMTLTFGAQVNNNTPAGLYSADLSLIATGKF